MDKPDDDDIASSWKRQAADLASFQKALPYIRAAGIESLERLWIEANGHSGQSRVIACFLLGLYNGTRFPFDLTEMRRVDLSRFEDAMAVLKMDYAPEQEVHLYIKNGGPKFEKLADDFRIKDRSKE